MPINTPWYADLRSELLSFPAGKHDDQVDALGLVGQLLDKMLAGTKLPATAPVKRDRWDRGDRDDEGSWKTV